MGTSQPTNPGRERPRHQKDSIGDRGLPAGGPRVLVVDDEREIADVLAELLAIDGHRADIAANGLIALEKLREQQYDLVVSDVRMPELDGPGLYRELERTRPEIARRFILCTGGALTED